NCAFGMVAADVVHEYSHVEPMKFPADIGVINSILVPMGARATERLASEGFSKERTGLDWSVELRYRRQVPQVVTPLCGSPPFTPAAIERLVQDFEELYERRFGRGSAFRAAGVELVNFRLRARGLIDAPILAPETLGGCDPKRAELDRH